MDLLSNSESIAHLEELLALYKKVLKMTVATFGREHDTSALEAQIHLVQDKLEEARAEPAFRLALP